MKIFIFILIGLIGGVIGGMGMGGGTLLIPMLTLFTNTEQHLAQLVNLAAFIPMSIAALIIHLKNKLVRYKYLLTVSLPATVASVPSALLARAVGGKYLSVFFGIFLIVLGCYQLGSVIYLKLKEKKQKDKPMN